MNYSTFWVKKVIDANSVEVNKWFGRGWIRSGFARQYDRMREAIPVSFQTENLRLAYLTLEPYGA